MKFSKFAAAVILGTIIAQAVHTIGAMLGMRYYMNPDFSPVWSKIMMPSSGPPPASFFYWSLGLGVVTWILFAGVYAVIKNGVPGSGSIRKGLIYGLLVFLVSGLSGSLALFLLINLPKGLIALWAAENLVIYLVNGAIVAKLS